jgi:hypothetical protein
VPSKPKCVLVRSLFRSERIKYNCSGVYSGVPHGCFARSEPEQNVGCNRSSHCHVVGGEGVHRPWLGQLGEGTFAGERHWPQFQGPCCATSSRARLGQIAHDNGLNLGRFVSDAHRSSQATMHAQNTQAVHGKNATTARGRSATMVRGKSATTARGRSTTNIGRGRTARASTTRGFRHGSSFRSGFSGSHGMRSMGHMSESRGMGSMGHGGGRGR